jgi:hypothetical protein
MLASSLTGIYVTLMCVCPCDAYLEGTLEYVSHRSDCGVAVCEEKESSLLESVPISRQEMLNVALSYR